MVEQVVRLSTGDHRTDGLFAGQRCRHCTGELVVDVCFEVCRDLPFPSFALAEVCAWRMQMEPYSAGRSRSLSSANQE